MRDNRWANLNRNQLGRYAEYLAKMEFTLHGLLVFGAEVDDRGIDFVVRTEAGVHYDVQVKSIYKGSYVFFSKDKFSLSPSLYATVIRFLDETRPELFLIPSTTWHVPNALFVERDYEGKKSKPEWGLNLSKKNLPLLEPFRFQEVIKRL